MFFVPAHHACTKRPAWWTAKFIFMKILNISCPLTKHPGTCWSPPLPLRTESDGTTSTEPWPRMNLIKLKNEFTLQGAAVPANKPSTNFSSVPPESHSWKRSQDIKADLVVWRWCEHYSDYSSSPSRPRFSPSYFSLSQLTQLWAGFSRLKWGGQKINYKTDMNKRRHSERLSQSSYARKTKQNTLWKASLDPNLSRFSCHTLHGHLDNLSWFWFSGKLDKLPQI